MSQVFKRALEVTSEFDGGKRIPVSMDMHAEQRSRLAAALKKATDVPAKSWICLQGGVDATRHASESSFFWAFGVKEPDCYGAIEVETGKSILFVPRVPDEYRIWMGELLTPERAAAMYAVDEAFYADEIASVFEKMEVSTLYTLHGLNTDSGKVHPAPELPELKCTINDSSLWQVMIATRAIKTEAELNLLRRINTLAAEGHLAALRCTSPGLLESQIEGIFRSWCQIYGEARILSYTPICASGPKAAVLHTGHAGAPNDRVMGDGELMLNDMGCEYHCYASDITVSYPINGKFTDDQKMVYNAVLDAAVQVMKTLKPGVFWPDMQTLAYQVILKHLVDGGVLVGDVAEMMEHNIGAFFMPHGLGHLMGIDTHDVGGYLEGQERDTRAGYKSVRLGRVLEPGMVLTVEPGLYFIDWLLDQLLADEKLSKFVNNDVLARFRGTGGVRLEDNCIITADGMESMTVVPRTVEQVEDAMAGKITSLAQVQRLV